MYGLSRVKREHLSLGIDLAIYFVPNKIKGEKWNSK